LGKRPPERVAAVLTAGLQHPTDISCQQFQRVKRSATPEHL
jgi:hypothetical protein